MSFDKVKLEGYGQLFDKMFEIQVSANLWESPRNDQVFSFTGKTIEPWL